MKVINDSLYINFQSSILQLTSKFYIKLWNNNLAAIFKAKLTLIKCQSQSIAFIGEVDTISPRMYRDLMFSL